MRLLTKYVGHRVAVTRWRPSTGHHDSMAFLTGGCGDANNYVTLWSAAPVDPEQSLTIDTEPRRVWRQQHPDGGVTSIEYFHSSDQFVTASTNGSVHLWRHNDNARDDGEVVILQRSWQQLHHLSGKARAPCTAIASHVESKYIATVGEDGRLAFLSPDVAEPAINIEDADSGVINDVCFVRSDQVLTVSTNARIKLWDVRAKQSAASLNSTISDEGISLPQHCVAVHPGQPHVVAMGGSTGTLSIWDLRHPKWPVMEMNTHEADIWDLCFAGTSSEYLFSASEDGNAILWNFNPTGAYPTGAYSAATDVPPTVENLLSGSAKQKIPVNSIDVVRDRVVCGFDNGAVCVIQDVFQKDK